jgi:hypothetical protein
MTHRETFMLFCLLMVTGTVCTVGWSEPAAPEPVHSVPALAPVYPDPPSPLLPLPPIGPVVFHPVEDWMLVPALLTAYTDHDPDAPLGPDGKPWRTRTGSQLTRS